MRITISDVRQSTSKTESGEEKAIEFIGFSHGEHVYIEIPIAVLIKLGYILNPPYNPAYPIDNTVH